MNESYERCVSNIALWFSIHDTLILCPTGLHELDVSLLATGTCQHLVFFLHFCCPFSYRTTIRFSIFYFFFSSQNIFAALCSFAAFLGGCLPQRWLVLDSFMPRRSCRFFHFTATLLFMFCTHKKRQAPILRAINIENFVFRFAFLFFSLYRLYQANVQSYKRLVIIFFFRVCAFTNRPQFTTPHIFVFYKVCFLPEKRATNHLKSSNWYGVDCF